MKPKIFHNNVDLFSAFVRMSMPPFLHLCLFELFNVSFQVSLNSGLPSPVYLAL